MISAEHDITLTEIARLERERAVIDDQIRRLRSTLPKQKNQPAPKTISKDAPLTPFQSTPVAEFRAGPTKPLDPVITDHAVIRYLERRMDFNFDAIKSGLLTKTVKLGISMGARSVKHDGGKFIINGHKVVTFVPDDMPRRRKGRR